MHLVENTWSVFIRDNSKRFVYCIISECFPNQSSHCSSGTSESVKSAEYLGCNVDGGKCIPRGPTPSRPAEIPFAPTMDNKLKLKEYLLRTFSSSAFNKCTHQPLQAMSGAPMKIEMKEESTPQYCFTPIPVPFNWKEKVKKGIEEDTRLGIISPVPQGEITEWCSRMVITPKSTGEPRRTIDFQKLNSATKRETHHTPSPFNLVSTIPPGMLKTVLDAWNGYHSLPLDPSSKRYTTFITEYGRYWYNRGPQGYHGTGDAYTRRFDDITKGEERYRRIVDDGLLYDTDIESAFWHTFDHLKLCADNGVVFNPSKFQFAEKVVNFAGFEVNSEGFRPSASIIDAIQNFPTPTSIVDIRSWFGLVNQVSYVSFTG